MNRLSIPLSILAAATLAACAEPVVRPAMPLAGTAIISQPVTGYRSGLGVVDSVTVTPGAAVAGGTATGASGKLNRLAIRMDAGGPIQYVDVESNEFRRGSRVELSPDRMIKAIN